jgi:hypothetical protein
MRFLLILYRKVGALQLGRRPLWSRPTVAGSLHGRRRILARCCSRSSARPPPDPYTPPLLHPTHTLHPASGSMNHPSTLYTTDTSTVNHNTNLYGSHILRGPPEPRRPWCACLVLKNCSTTVTCTCSKGHLADMINACTHAVSDIW